MSRLPELLLPKEIKNIGNTKKRKDLFIKIVLPLIIKENTKIKLDRKRLFAILKKSSNSEIEKKWLSKLNPTCRNSEKRSIVM